MVDQEFKFGFCFPGSAGFQREGADLRLQSELSPWVWCSKPNRSGRAALNERCYNRPCQHTNTGTQVLRRSRTHTYTQVFFFSASLDVFIARVEGVDLSSTSLETCPLCPDNHSSGLSLSASIFRVLWREGSGGPEEVHWVQFKSTVWYQSVLVVKIGEL